MMHFYKEVTLGDMASNCCGADVIEPDICTACKEHCEPISTLSDLYYIYRKIDYSVSIETIELTLPELTATTRQLDRDIIDQKIDGWVVEKVDQEYYAGGGEEIDINNFDQHEKEECFINFIRYNKDVEPITID